MEKKNLVEWIMVMLLEKVMEAMKEARSCVKQKLNTIKERWFHIIDLTIHFQYQMYNMYFNALIRPSEF